MKPQRWLLGVLMTTLVGCGVPEKENMYGFSVQNWKAKTLEIAINATHLGQRFTLLEDSFAYSEQNKIACVADGVRRDFLDRSVAYISFKNLMKFFDLQYPSPSPAREAADICVKTFMDNSGLDYSFWIANKKIEESKFNRLLKCNYLDKDLAGCTAAGFSAVDDYFLNWASINAAGIAILGENGNLRFKSIDDGEHSPEKNPYLEQILNQHGGFNNPEGRKLIRSQYRNNPKEEFAYGVLTGEATATKYINQGVEEVKTGEFVLLFTDGIRELLFPKDENGREQMKVNDKYLTRILKEDTLGLKRLCRQNVSTEGTLVVWNVK